jgi:2-haloacid dehalogenase
MSSKDKIVIAFDLYGTLLSTESIAKDLATHFGQEQANKIAALWRRFVSLSFWVRINADSCRYQLEYTWRMNSMSTFSRPYMPRPSLILE